jgi:hypothetical protein
MIFGVEHARHLAERHAGNDWHREICCERKAIGIEHRSFDAFAAEWVGAIENVERDVMPRGGFHRVAHRRDVSIETHAGILKIENQRVHAIQHRVGRTSCVSIQTVNWQAGCGIGRRRNRRVLSATNAVLRAEQRDKLHAGRVG